MRHLVRTKNNFSVLTKINYSEAIFLWKKTKTKEAQETQTKFLNLCLEISVLPRGTLKCTDLIRHNSLADPEVAIGLKKKTDPMELRNFFSTNSYFSG